mmetsp:Transcript_117806/g.234718  ORF Transcript_117806/g.234718 Transcript_117806/m.234718 type:complete len:81 (-) Transcript_117806:147-389(-)
MPVWEGCGPNMAKTDPLPDMAVCLTESGVIAAMACLSISVLELQSDVCAAGVDVVGEGDEFEKDLLRTTARMLEANARAA